MTDPPPDPGLVRLYLELYRITPILIGAFLLGIARLIWELYADNRREHPK